MSRVKTAGIIVGSLIFFTAGGFLLEQWGNFARVRKTVHNGTVPSGLLNYGTLGKLMKQLGLVIAVPNDRARFSPTSEQVPDVNASLFRRKRYEGEYLFEANPGGYTTIPSSGAVSRKVLSPGLPVLSVVVQESDLFGKERGIVKNFKNSGKLWERLAYVSYFEGGRVVFATAAGIRLHGGSSRGEKGPQSYRLYFRGEYGSDQFKPGVLFSRESEPITHLVVHNILNWQSRFNPVIALDIARRIGCAVPETKVVRFVLNGRPQGYYYLSEHLNKSQWSSRIGHDNFAFYKFRGSNERKTAEDHRRLEKWAGDPTVKMTMAEAGKIVDVDNMSRQLFSWMYCNTMDQVQGVAVLDREVPGSRWYWINWDMDQSFANGYRGAKNIPFWKQPSIELAAGLNANWMKAMARPTLFRRLMEEDPEYRVYFVNLVTDLLNHRLTPGYFETLMDSYALLPPFPVYSEEGQAYIAERTRLKRDISSFRKYFRHRSYFLRQELREYFKLGEEYSCRIEGLPFLEYQVDGYPEVGNYAGHYFKGRTVTVRIVSPPEAMLSYWLVNGKEVRGEKLIHIIDDNTVIRPVLKNSDALVNAAKAADPHRQALEWIRANVRKGTALVISPELGLDTTELADNYNIFMWDYKRSGEEVFDQLSLILENPYFLVPVIEAYGLDERVEKEVAFLKDFREQLEPGIEFGHKAQLLNYYYPQSSKNWKFVIGCIETKREGNIQPASIVWNPEAAPSETSPALRLFSRRGEFTAVFTASERGNILEIRNTAPGDKGKRWTSFGYEVNQSGFGMTIPGGKYIYMLVEAAVSPPLINNENYLLVSDFDGVWKSRKVFFTSPEWRTYIISKKVQMGSTRLLLGARFAPGSESDTIRIRKVKLFISDRPLQ
jgi:hypothetical protein